MRMSKRTDSVTHVPLISRRMIPILTMVVLFLSWQDSPGFLAHAQAQESQSEVEVESDVKIDQGEKLEDEILKLL